MAKPMKLMDVCNAVLDASADWKAGKRENEKVTVNDVVFDLSELGYCQRAARKAHEAATGRAMPGAACCAGHTYRNLRNMRSDGVTHVGSARWSEVVKSLKPGDFLYFDGGKACGTCGCAVGHVGIWLGKHDGVAWMYQNTSRNKLGYTREGPAQSQKTRFLGAFRFAGVE